jgi:NAD(P)-dependent dehydrogenase (short-subunit alcohol dehydrogenase family)
VRDASFLDHRESDWDDVFDTNVKGMFRATQVAARGMKRREGGSIVNIASITGLRQAGGIASYAVSKAAVIQRRA